MLWDAAEGWVTLNIQQVQAKVSARVFVSEAFVAPT